MSWRGALLLLLSAAACSPPTSTPDVDQKNPRRIISLDYCADQYLIALAPRDNIAGISPDATKAFSYLRQEATGLPIVRPRAEDIILHKPDAVIRSYGGGANITALLERLDIDVIQLGYANSLEDIRGNIAKTAKALNATEAGNSIIAKMDERLEALDASPPKSILYVTSKGAVAGAGTLIDHVITEAGQKNFNTANGWAMIDLEALVDNQPDVIAASFFDGADANTDQWSPSRHSVMRRLMAQTPVVETPGAWTSCGAWFIVDAIEAIADAPSREVTR